MLLCVVQCQCLDKTNPALKDYDVIAVEAQMPAVAEMVSRRTDRNMVGLSSLSADHYCWRLLR